MLRNVVQYLVLAVALMCSGCGESLKGGEAGARADLSAAGDRLAERAARETAGAERCGPVRVAPAPPGVDPAVLTVRENGRSRALLGLAEALEELALTPGIPEAEGGEAEADSAQREEALAHFLRGREAGYERRHRDAIAELEQARALDPGQPEILQELAKNYVGLGNVPAAASLYGLILRADPHHSEALWTVGQVAANRRESRQAAWLLGRPRAVGDRFTHDPAAMLLADHELHRALIALGYDRAGIEAGRAALKGLNNLNEPTFYRQQVRLLSAKRGELWRSIGDAHCRLGEYEAALGAYGESAGHAERVATGLLARVLYAELRLGHVHRAQRTVYESIRSNAPEVPGGLLRLCQWLKSAGGESETLRAAVEQLSEQDASSGGLVRAVAALHDEPEAVAVLESFVARRPRELGAVGDLLRLMGKADPAAAVELTARLVSGQADLAQEYVDRLVPALRSPARVVMEGEGAGFATPQQAQVHARILRSLWSSGEAWQVCRRALARWPDDDGLRLLQIELAGELDEPELLERALEQAGAVNSAWSWLVRSRSLREAEQYERAVEAAGRGLSRTADGAERGLALAELAGARAARAASMQISERRAEGLREAAEAAEQAISLAPGFAEPYEMLLALYGQGGPLADPARAAALRDRLRTEHRGSPLLVRLAIDEALKRADFEDGLESALALCASGEWTRESVGAAAAAWQRMGRAGDAERWLRGVLERRPGDPTVLEQLVMLLVRDGRVDAARQLLEERLVSGAGDPVAWKLLERVCFAGGDLPSAVAFGEQCLLARPQGGRRALELALLYARGGMPEEAMKQVDWIAEHADAAAYRHLTGAIGLCGQLRSLGDRSERVTARLVERTIDRFPDVPIKIFAVGLRALARLDQTGERFEVLARRAARESKEASDVSAHGAGYWKLPAQALIESSAPEEAGRVLRARLESGHALEPGAYATLAVMALMADAASPGRAEDTIALVKDLEARGLMGALPGTIEPVQTLSEALMTVSELYMLVGNNEGAKRLCLEVIWLEPDNALAINNLAYQLLEEGQSDGQTASMIEHAAALLPENSAVADTLGWLRYKQGRFADAEGGAPGAVTLLERAIALSTAPEAELLDHYGDALWRAGRHEAARGQWEQARQRLDEPQITRAWLQTYQRAQTAWGLLVLDARAIYDRELGAVLKRVARKLEAVEAGEEPPVAPTFAEMSLGGASTGEQRNGRSQ